MVCERIVEQKTVLLLSCVLDFGRFCEENSNNCHGDHVCPRPAAVRFSRQILRQIRVKVAE
jgi:hypothetical protein